jgi:hypothetical protein
VPSVYQCAAARLLGCQDPAALHPSTSQALNLSNNAHAAACLGRRPRRRRPRRRSSSSGRRSRGAPTCRHAPPPTASTVACWSCRPSNAGRWRASSSPACPPWAASRAHTQVRPSVCPILARVFLTGLPAMGGFQGSWAASRAASRSVCQPRFVGSRTENARVPHRPARHGRLPDRGCRSVSLSARQGR